MSIADLMQAAYLEAAVFTDCAGEEGQPPSDAEFSRIAECQAWSACHNLYMANTDYIGEDNCVQAAHDLWLTRNHHGAGFWDRPEIYGTEAAHVLTRCAESMGQRSVCQGDDGLLYFEEG